MRKKVCNNSAALAVACLLALAWPAGAPATVGDAASSATLRRQADGTDSRAAEFARRMMLNLPAMDDATSSPVDADDLLAAWRDYARASSEAEPKKREKALRRVYRKSDSPLLRGLTLRTISEDPVFQSRQAMFLRDYGFYANWFNRLLYSTGRVLQGNLQAILQLGIDTVHDLFRPPEANEYERRAYALMQRRQAAAQRAGGLGEGEDRKLERAVDRALAKADIERAEWAFDAGDPGAAAFYASQAEIRRPDWSRATSLRLDAESAIAEQRRNALASAQVGYPDRTPPIELPAPDIARAAILPTAPPRSEAALTSATPLIAAMLRALPDDGRPLATQMRGWPAMMEEYPAASEYHRRWLEALYFSPRHNPDLRLELARERRRGQFWRYVFIGPERPRERAYKTATWATQAMDAMQNVGIFYVFEVLGRTGQVLFSPPVPADEVLDAQGAWLRIAPDLHGPEARRVAREMADEYERQQRFAEARETLDLTGSLDAKSDRRLKRAEARHLLDIGDRLTTGPQQAALVRRASALAPDVAAKRLERNASRRPPPPEIETWNVRWPALAEWTALPPPCGLPGEAAWFDGDPANGESSDAPLELRHEVSARKVTVTYRVAMPEGTRIHQREVKVASLPDRMREWLELSREQRLAAGTNIEKLDRLPIPFELQGGLGPSGIDFYPKLLPIQTRPGEIELYQ